jgi:putative transposase
MPLPEDVIFADPDRAIERHHKNLPHWQQEGATYFLTFRLDDSIPRHLLTIWQDERDIWLRLHPEPWSPQIEEEYHNRFSGRIDHWLDEGHGSNLLQDPPASGIVASVLQTFDGMRYTHHAWVVMPNHVHALFTLHIGWRLENTVKSWKGVSARKINTHFSREGSLWMMDYFDRLIRDEAHFWRCARYIRGNPAKAGLDVGTFILHESDSVRQHLDAAGV